MEPAVTEKAHGKVPFLFDLDPFANQIKDPQRCAHPLGSCPPMHSVVTSANYREERPMATARQRRTASQMRRDDPKIRQKVTSILDACDEGLDYASETLKSVEAMLSKYSYADDVYLRNLWDIQEINYSLAKLIAYRKSLGRDLYISKLSEGPLGAEIQRLGDKFVP
jgi:hypothetical protein